MERVEGDLAIRQLCTPSDYADLAALIGAVWVDPSGRPPVATDLLAALAHFGGYVAGAWSRDGTLVAGGYGFIGRHDVLPVLHSHTVCVAPGLEHHGIGFRIKQHQRAWAAEHGLAAVTWTFDPLVRRNAYFNLTKLGATVVGYEIDLYGPLRDSTNAGDETDRVVVWWPVADAVAASGPEVDTVDTVRVFVPDDIVSLRHTAPDEARAHRMRVREELGDRLGAGWRATAMSRDGWYTLVSP